MKTFEEQQAFFQTHKQAIQDAALESGAAGVGSFIGSFEDTLERRVLWLFCRQALYLDSDYERDLDTYLASARVGIDDCLAQAEAEEDDELAKRRTDVANIISYNLAADLADCWPEDGLSRERRHFEAGLAAALDCVRWREELDKPPFPRSIAWWVRGMHELSLGQLGDAVSSFQRSTEYARLAAEGDETAFGVVLARGYESIARGARGEDGALELWNESEELFTKQLDDAERAADARFGLDQLLVVRERYWPASA